MLHLYKHSFPIISGDICEYKLINSGYVHVCVPGLGSITKGQLQLQLQLLSVWQPLVNYNYNYNYVTFNYVTVTCTVACNYNIITAIPLSW